MNLQPTYPTDHKTQPLPPHTSDKWKNKLMLAGKHWPSQRRAVALLLQFKKKFKNCWNKGKTSVSHILWKHDTSNALKWRILQNPDYISRHFLTQVQTWVACLHCIWPVRSGMLNRNIHGHQIYSYKNYLNYRKKKEKAHGQCSPNNAYLSNPLI